MRWLELNTSRFSTYLGFYTFLMLVKNHGPIHLEREEILRITSGVINKSVYCQETRYTAFIFLFQREEAALKEKLFVTGDRAGKLGTFMAITIMVAFDQQLWEKD